MSLIRWPYRLLALAALAVALIGFGWVKGAGHVQARWDAAGIALSTVAGTVAANYQTCHENAEQLRALQAWVKEMGRAITPAP